MQGVEQEVGVELGAYGLQLGVGRGALLFLQSLLGAGGLRDPPVDDETPDELPKGPAAQEAREGGLEAGRIA